MTTLGQSESTISKHNYSPLILERRRSLFPTNNCDIDFELGHIRPLSSDSTSSSEEEERTHISDYDILGVMNKQGLETPTTKESSEPMSLLHLSPFTQAGDGTPKKFSPSQNLKTPHDSSSKTNLPKVQRNLLEQSKSLKRITSCLDSPVEEYFCRLQEPSGRVRTALFPSEPDGSLSAKIFYPKSEENILEKLYTNKENHTIKSVTVVSTKHSVRYNKKIGQINNGVRHKIRKPKQKKSNMTPYRQATKKLLTSGAPYLKEYIQDLVEIKKLQTSSSLNDVSRVENGENLTSYLKDLGNIQNKTTLIEHVKPLRQVSENKKNTALEIRKRPFSPVEELENTNRKFFKSVKKHRISLGNNKSDVDLVKKSQSLNTTKLARVTDFDVENEIDVIPNVDIENILSILSQQSPKARDRSDHFEAACILNTDVINNSHTCNNVSKSIECCHINLSKNQLGLLTQNKCKRSQVYEERLNRKQQNTVILKAHSSILTSENSINLHNRGADAILSPISQMCDVTSGLALDSPKKGKNLTTILNGMSNASTHLHGSDSMEHTLEQKKLYPIFYGNVKSSQTISIKDKNSKINDNKLARKLKELPEGQMLLDAGQKRFGYTLCGECNLVYHMGDPGEEIEHMSYHNSSRILRFAGWKNEHVIADYQKNGRIIRIVSSDSKVWLKKVKDLMQVVTRDLGCPDVNLDTSQSQVYLYIKNRTIAGCVVATVPKTRGHRMLSNSDSVALCSEETYSIKCGVSHIWVAPNLRKQRIATALIDAVKGSFIKGLVLRNNDIALTCPTDAGAAFASKYFKTSNYLIYYS